MTGINTTLATQQKCVDALVQYEKLIAQVKIDITNPTSYMLGINILMPTLPQGASKTLSYQSSSANIDWALGWFPRANVGGSTKPVELTINIKNDVITASKTFNMVVPPQGIFSNSRVTYTTKAHVLVMR